MSRRSSRSNTARKTKYPFIRITDVTPTKADLKWATQVLPAEGMDGIIDFLLADAPEDGISEEVIRLARDERLGQSTLMAVVSNIYMHQHNAAVRSEHKKVYRHTYGLTDQDAAVNLLLVGPLDRCRRVIEVCDQVVSDNPLLPTVADTSFAEAGLSAPPVVVRNFLTEVDAAPTEGDPQLHLSVDADGEPLLFRVSPPPEIIYGDSDTGLEDIHAVLSVDDGSVTHAGTPDGVRLQAVTDAIPFKAMAERYAKLNDFAPEQVLTVVSVLQLVSVNAPDKFRVLVVGDRERSQLLTALSIAVWGWGMFGLRGRTTNGGSR